MNKSSFRLWHWQDEIGPLRLHLAEGGVVAIPTESSYGLAAHPLSRLGVERIYRIKERDRGKPLPVVVADIGQTLALGVDPNDPLLREVAPHWPAALTAIVALHPRAEIAAAARGSSLAVRIPAHQQLRDLLERLGHGLTATSANRSGEDPIVDLDGLRKLLSGNQTGEPPVWVVDGAVLPGGPHSTMLSFRAGRVVVERAGSFDWR